MPPNTKTAKAVDAPAKPEATGATPTPPAPEVAPAVTASGEVTGTVETRPDDAAPGVLIPGAPWPYPPEVSIDLLRGEAVEVPPIKILVRCHRPQGIYRAGRFWPAEDTPVLASDFSLDELLRLRAEPLLSIRPQLDQE